MREHEDHGEGAVQKKTDRLVSDMEVLEKSVENSFATEDCFPSVAADQIADPERNDDELVQQFLARAGMKREVVGERVAEENGTERYRGCDAHGAQENLGVQRIGEEFLVIGEIPVMDEGAVLNRPEAVGKHERVGQQQEERHPEERRGG